MTMTADPVASPITPDTVDASSVAAPVAIKPDSIEPSSILPRDTIEAGGDRGLKIVEEKSLRAEQRSVGLEGIGAKFTHDSIPGATFENRPEGLIETPESTKAAGREKPLAIPRSQKEVAKSMRDYVNQIEDEAERVNNSGGARSPFRVMSQDQGTVRVPRVDESTTPQELVSRYQKAKSYLTSESSKIIEGGKAYDPSYMTGSDRNRLAMQESQTQLDEMAREHVKTNPHGAATAGFYNTAAGFSQTAGQAVDAAKAAFMDQSEIAQRNRDAQAAEAVARARRDEHPMASSLGFGAGRMVSPEMLATMFGGTAAIGAGILSRAGVMTAGTEAEKASTGQPVTPVKDFAGNVVMMGAGHVAGTVARGAAEGGTAAQQAAVRAAGHAVGGAAGGLAVGAAEGQNGQELASNAILGGGMGLGMGAADVAEPVRQHAELAGEIAKAHPEMKAGDVTALATRLQQVGVTPEQFKQGATNGRPSGTPRANDVGGQQAAAQRPVQQPIEPDTSENAPAIRVPTAEENTPSEHGGYPEQQMSNEAHPVHNASPVVAAKPITPDTVEAAIVKEEPAYVRPSQANMTPRERQLDDMSYRDVAKIAASYDIDTRISSKRDLVNGILKFEGKREGSPERRLSNDLRQNPKAVPPSEPTPEVTKTEPPVPAPAPKPTDPRSAILKHISENPNASIDEISKATGLKVGRGANPMSAQLNQLLKVMRDSGEIQELGGWGKARFKLKEPAPPVGASQATESTGKTVAVKEVGKVGAEKPQWWESINEQSLTGKKIDELRDIAEKLGRPRLAKVFGKSPGQVKDLLKDDILREVGKRNDDANSRASLMPKFEAMPWHQIEKYISDLPESEKPQGSWNGRSTSAGRNRYQAADEVLAKKLEAQRARAEEISIGDTLGKEKSPLERRAPGFKTAADKKAVQEGADPKEVTRLSERRQNTEPDAIYQVNEGGGNGTMQKLKDFVKNEPEFRADPTFTVKGTGDAMRLEWKDGGTYRFVPEAIGFKTEELTEGTKIRVNPDSLLRAKANDSIGLATSGIGEPESKSAKNIPDPLTAVKKPSARDIADAKSLGILKPDAFANTKAAVKKAMAALKNPKNTTLGSGLGGLSDVLEHATNISVAVVKDLANAGKHGFEHFVKAISANISNPRLRAMMLFGERDPSTKKMVGGARALYNAAREHPDITAHGIQNAMTPADKLPDSLTIAGLAKRTPEQVAAHDAERKAADAFPPKRPTEAQTIRAATVKPEETTKGTIRRTAGMTDPNAPTVPESKALAAKLDIEQALTGKAWMAEDARTKITAAAKQTLPPELRGEFLHAVSTAKNQTDIDNATGRMETNLARHNMKNAYRSGSETLAGVRIANIPAEFADRARSVGEQLKGALRNIRELPARLRPKGEPAATAETMNAYIHQVNTYVDQIKAAVAEGRQFQRDKVAKAGTTPPEPSKAEKAPLGRRIADTAHDLINTREQYSYLRRDYSPEVQDAAEHRIQAKKEATGTYNRFVASGLPHDPAIARRVMADMTRLGWHNRINDLRSDAFQKAIDAGMDEDAARAASERVARGIPDTGPEGAAKIKADPLVRKAAMYWLENIATAQEENLKRSGQGVKGWSGNAKKLADPIDGLMMNLPPDRPSDPEHFGTRRRTYNQAEALLDPTTGNAEYMQDIPRVLQNNISYPIRARTAAELAKAVQDGGFAFDPDAKEVRQADDGRVYVNVKGVERPARGVLMDDAEGLPQPKFVPQDLVGIHNFAQPSDTEKGKVAARIMNSYITARLAFGADVGYHAWRELGNVSEVIAREGDAASSVPWLGGRAMAAQRAYQTATMPHGDMLQLLADRGGFDRGTGYYVREHDPSTPLQKGLQYGHQLLFGPKGGIDTNLRRVLAESFIRTKIGSEAYAKVSDAVNSGRMSKAAGADRIADLLGAKNRIGMKNFVNRTVGENNHLLRAQFLNKLQFVMPFLGQNVGSMPSEAGRFLTGNIPFRAVAEHAGRGNHVRAASAVVGSLMSGAIGAYLAANLLNYGATSFDKDKEGKPTGGKWMWENAPGHRLTPYILPGVRWTNMSPGDSRPARVLGAQTAVNEGSIAAGLKDIPRNVINELLSAIPLLDPIMATVGKSPYMTRGNQLGSASPEDLKPLSVGGETVKSLIQNTRGKPGATPVGQAVAKDTAGLAGERISFDDDRDTRRSAKDALTARSVAGEDVQDDVEKAVKSDAITRSDAQAIYSAAKYKDLASAKFAGMAVKDKVTALEGMSAEDRKRAIYRPDPKLPSAPVSMYQHARNAVGTATQAGSAKGLTEKERLDLVRRLDKIEP